MLQFQPKQVILVDDGLANRGIGNRIVHALLLTDRSTAGTHSAINRPSDAEYPCRFSLEYTSAFFFHPEDANTA